MTTFIIIVFVAYFMLLAALFVGWHKALQPINQSLGTDWRGFITVVIAVRNEENTILNLLNDISHQKYDNFEVIVVDDQSEDNTRMIIEEFVATDRRFYLQRSSGSGKKKALAEGIRAARGSVIVTTDADCSVPEYWLDGLRRYFSDELVLMVFGAVRIKASTFFSDLQSLEFLSLIGSGAAMAGLGFPVMCNGANLAFRKDSFNEVDGYNGNFHIPSGDDEFLMRKILTKYPQAIRFASDRQSIVTTAPSCGVADFVNQRIRWAGKWRMNTSFSSKILALLILCFQLCVLSLPVLLVTNSVDIKVAVLLLLLKGGLECIFLRSIGRFFNSSWRWIPFMMLQLIYPPYIVLVGIFSNFRSFQWKGRKLKSLMVSRY